MAKNNVDTQLGRPLTAVDHFPELHLAKLVVPIIVASFGFALLITAARQAWQPHFFESFSVLYTYLAVLSAAGALLLERLAKFGSSHHPRNAYFASWVLLQLINISALTLAHKLLSNSITLQHLPLIPTLLFAALLSAFAFRYIFISTSWRLSQAQAQRAHRQAESARIRPHFLFNTLTTIAELTRINPSEAEHAIEDLAQLYRSSLAQLHQHASLAVELHTARSYLSIEQHRIGSRMTQQWDTDSLPHDAKLPVLTIQPLVENAVYHGIGPLAAGGVVSIKGWREEGDLLIEITNPVPDFERSNRHAGNSMAVNNIRQRLQTTFDERASMNIKKTDNEYCVTLRFPYVTHKVQG